MYDRYRERTNINTFPITWYMPAHGVISENLYLSSVEKTWDNKTPDYWRLSAAQRRELPVNPFKNQKYKIHDAGKSVRWSERSGTNPCSQPSALTWAEGQLGIHLLRSTYSVWPTLAPPSGATGDLATADQLIPEALAEARLQNMDIGTMLAELTKTVDLVKGVRSRVLKRANKITTKLRRKGKLDRVAPRSASNAAALERAKRVANGEIHQSFLDAFQETWMEDRYGWRILAYDLEALQETWIKMQQGVGPIVKGAASHERAYDEYVNSRTFAVLKTPGYQLGMLYYTCDYYRRMEESRRVGLGYQFAVNSLVTIDPIITGLEVVRFSFIADWFTNLGDIVRAYSPFGMGSVKWLWTNVLLESRHSATFTSQGVGSTYATCPKGDTVFADTARSSFERTPLVWADHRPAIRFFNDIDLPKVLDILSVVRGLSGAFSPWLRT